MDILITFILVIGVYLLQRRLFFPFFEDRERRYPERIAGGYMDLLFFVHLILFWSYFMYASFNASDSKAYFENAIAAESWFDLWGTDTKFIQWVAWPFVKQLGLSYFSTMLVFAYFGFNGLFLLYLSALENVPSLPKVLGQFTMLEILFLLPNAHFWSSSLGKGSVMIFSIGLAIYGLSRFNKRLLMIFIGCFIMYMVRPHILFALVIGGGAAMMTGVKGLNWRYQLPILIVTALLFFVLSDSVIQYAGTEDLDVFNSSAIEKRANDLARKSNSGVNINDYNQAAKLFTFWFRPLFVDAPNFIGVLSSFENVFILFLFIRSLFIIPWHFRSMNGWFKINIFFFLLASIALAQVMANLGIAMRQKAQLMPLFFIIYVKLVEMGHSKRAMELTFSLSKQRTSSI